MVVPCFVPVSYLKTVPPCLLYRLACCTALLLVPGEIGDTWIHGVASDPARMADYRAVLRARDACVQDPHCDSQVGLTL
jgi:hypothetical protein